MFSRKKITLENKYEKENFIKERLLNDVMNLK